MFKRVVFLYKFERNGFFVHRGECTLRMSLNMSRKTKMGYLLLLSVTQHHAYTINKFSLYGGSDDSLHVCGGGGAIAKVEKGAMAPQKKL